MREADGLAAVSGDGLGMPPPWVVSRGRSLGEADPEIAALVTSEQQRQQEKLSLIASENFASSAVLEADGTVLTNKYAEGIPGARVYGGCQCVDLIEDVARDRLCQLFGAEYANVQPHSGSQANMAAYLATCKPGDTILSLDMAHGGHPSHGSPANFSGRVFRFVHYSVDRETERIRMDDVEWIARKEKPALIVAGASRYPRTLDFAAFGVIAASVGARLMVDMAHIAGLVAAGLHPNPVPVADIVTTTTHKTLRGPRGGAILCRAELSKAVDQAVFPGVQGGPLMHIVAAKAVCFREAAEPAFADYQRQVLRNAATLAQSIADRGFRLVTGGTDNHLFLVDLRRQGLHGRQAERALEDAGLLVNKSLIPFDPQSPTRTSGLRIGTPAVTSRGMGEAEMTAIGGIVADVLAGTANGRGSQEAAVQTARIRVAELADRFPASL